MDEYNNKCIFCGSSNGMNIDDEYTNSYQELTKQDLQVLCQHCNTIKRGGKELPPFLEPLRDLQKYLEYDPKYM